ncbi:hypothetical protein [Rhizobium lentis]|uniref:hypothetical protein n=1 Tax=Rhizobium lentis TaxID=1138194 RepID=UPI0035C8B990
MKTISNATDEPDIFYSISFIVRKKCKFHYKNLCAVGYIIAYIHTYINFAALRGWMEWRVSEGHGKRSLVENAIGRYKSIIGRARSPLAEHPLSPCRRRISNGRMI